MLYRLAKAAVAIAILVGPVIGTRAQASDLPCDAFVKNDDGSWSALRSVPISGTGEKLTIRVGSVLRPGADIRGLDLATMLDRQCPATAEPAEPAQPVQSATTPPQPHIALSTYGDLYGNIDPQRLSCGQLADASSQEAELLLAWYSGWYSGAAKKRAINLAKVGGAIRSVMDYCRGNRDKKLIPVMELMLK